MKTVVLTSDKHNWLLRGFFHQWQKYAAGYGEVEVAGFTNPGTLPNDVPFVSIGRFEDYPVEKWSDAVIKYLQSIKDNLVMILLEDYWLMRPIHQTAITAAEAFMLDNPNVARFDVAADRMFSRDAEYFRPYGPFDLCWGKGAYSLSFQASIYRRSMLLEMMRPNETPWQTELNGSDRLNKSPYFVAGTYQWPVNYAIVVNKGRLDRYGGWMFPARTLKQSDWAELDELGYTKEPEAQHV
jgi:hypothetical protein